MINVKNEVLKINSGSIFVSSNLKLKKIFCSWDEISLSGLFEKLW